MSSKGNRMEHRTEHVIPTLSAVLDRGYPVEIRATHWAGFRSGEWAVVYGAEMVAGRSCYLVRFSDGVTDHWPRYDPNDPYEFRPEVSR